MAPTSGTPVPTSPAPPDVPAPPPALPASETMTFESLKTKIAWAGLIGGPILMALPPRKLDLYTFSLAGMTLWSTNHLVKAERGTGIAGRIGQMVPLGDEMPTERAREVQEMQRRAREEREGLVREGQRAKEEGGLLGRLGWGGEKERRGKEEREMIEEKGYGGVIADQIWEVVNHGKKEAEEVEERELKEAVEKKTGKPQVDERRRREG